MITNQRRLRQRVNMIEASDFTRTMFYIVKSRQARSLFAAKIINWNPLTTCT